jgi:hypothetical protein
MKPSALLCTVLLLFVFSSVRGAEDPRLAGLRSADDDRVAAIKSGDAARLTAIFSDELHYAHSSGSVDDKASFVGALTSGKTKYVGLDYEKRDFTFPAPGLALMTGRARVQVQSERGTMDSVLSFLAVWREEKGRWRFLAWQSCKVAPPAEK